MEIRKDNNTLEYTIDIMQIAKVLWKKAWLIVLCGLVGAAIEFYVASYTIAPTYASSIKLYVNNSTVTLGKTSVSVGEISAAKSLVKTYSEILDSRSTLERVIEEAEVDYSWRQLSGMIQCDQCNETEIMLVTVTSTDPYEASKIANTITEVLPVRISEIIDGASMEVVDTAVPQGDKLGPNVTRYTAMGFAVGAALCAGIFALFAVLDNTIHDEEYILSTYDFPILGKIPNLLNTGNKSYGYRYQKYQSKAD